MNQATSRVMCRYLNERYKHIDFEYFFRENNNGKRTTAFSWEKNDNFDKKIHQVPNIYEVRDVLMLQKDRDDAFPTLKNFLELPSNPKNWFIQLFEPEEVRIKRERKELKYFFSKEDDDEIDL